jgi:DNA-binding response OmpR family regulator
MPRVLIVEDDAKIRDIMKWILEKSGFEVSVAVDGPAGLAAAVSSPPDVVLLDLMLPQMSGFDVLEQIRARELTKHLPVVIVSARSPTERPLGAARDLGATGYLAKPFKSEMLVAVVREIISRKT